MKNVLEKLNVGERDVTCMHPKMLSQFVNGQKASLKRFLKSIKASTLSGSATDFSA